MWPCFIAAFRRGRPDIFFFTFFLAFFEVQICDYQERDRIGTPLCALFWRQQMSLFQLIVNFSLDLFLSPIFFQAVFFHDSFFSIFDLFLRPSSALALSLFLKHPQFFPNLSEFDFFFWPLFRLLKTAF